MWKGCASRERHFSREFGLRRSNYFAALRLDELFGLDSWADGPGYYISRRWRFDSTPSLTVGLLPRCYGTASGSERMLPLKLSL